MAVYLMGIYMSEFDRDQFFADYRATGKRLDIGESCVRFRKLENLPLELVGQAIGSIPMSDFVEQVKALRSASR